MKPSTNKYYQVKELTIFNVVTIVIQEYATFSKNKLLNIHLLNTNFAKMIPKLQRWLQIDFSMLHNPCLNYKSQMQIDPHQVCMANTAMAHFGLDPGRFVQWMGGEYTGQHQDRHSTLAAVRGHVSADDYAHMKHILLDGYPAQLDFEEPLSNQIEMIERRNSNSFNNNTTLVLKTKNKEDRYSHLIPLDEIHGEGGPRAHRKARTPSQRCKLGLPPAYHLYASIAYALSENKRFLADSSPEFQTLIKSLHSGYFFCNVKDQIHHISFAIKRSAKLDSLQNWHINPGVSTTSPSQCTRR
jgi:hypothetical protein